MRQRWLGVLAAFLFLALPLSLHAQNGTVTGTVADAESGLGLQDAAIEVLGTGDTQAAGLFSDASGNYRLTVPAGTYSVVVSLLGYETVRVDGVSVTAGGTATVDVSLSSTAFLLNPIVVSASRRAEKALEAPARVEIIGQEIIQERAATSAVEHVKGVPGMDIAQSGLSQSNVVARGFNNIFSGALLVLTDNRYGRVPSIRVNAFNFIPLNNLDLERMEVVLGPGAALYGPNSASGVLHMITRSPIDDPGNTIALAGGERSVFQGQFRTAWTNNENFGFKLSGKYFQGNDWQSTDLVEETARQDAIDDGDDPGLIAQRDFDQQSYGLDGRMDFRMDNGSELIVNAGFNNSVSSIELTGIGAGQADNWQYSYAQSRFTKGRLFAQVFLNSSNAGDTYLLRTGQPIVDMSKFYAAQVQHGITLGDDVQNFTYGLDFQWTRPNTDGTINGQNEDDDGINEVGGYVHSETALSDKIDLVAALRVDNHSQLDDVVFSPRAALVFRPDENQNIRLTFNRAFSTPTSNNLFLDILAGQIPLGPGLAYDIRARGTPSTGFTFNDTCPGGLNGFCMRSPFQPGQQVPALGSAFFNGLAPTVIGLLLQQAQVDPTLAPLIPVLQNPAVLSLLAGGDPIGAIQSVFLRLNTEDQTFGADPGPMAIDRLKPTTYNTFEIGYKGLINDRVLVAGDFYRTKVNDFVGPLRVETPMLFLDPASTGAYIAQQLAPLAATLPATALQGLIQALTGAYAQVPIGTVVPDQFDDETVLVAYRNFGDVSYWGADLSAQVIVSDRVSVNASYSRVSKDCFDADNDGTVDCNANNDIALNASKNKGSLGLRFNDERTGVSLDGRVRFQAEFPMNSGVYVGTVDGYTLFDANVAYQLPFYPGATFGITASNLFNSEHIEFVGAPMLGRLLLTRVQINF